MWSPQCLRAHPKETQCAAALTFSHSAHQNRAPFTNYRWYSSFHEISLFHVIPGDHSWTRPNEKPAPTPQLKYALHRSKPAKKQGTGRPFGITNGVKPLQSSPGRLASHLHAERQAQPQAAGLLPWPRFPAVLCVRLRRTSPESVSRICTILKHQKYTLKNRPFSVACLGASINGQWEVRNFLLHLQWITSDLTTTQPKENDCRASGLIPPILRRHSAPPAAEAPHTNRRSRRRTPGHRRRRRPGTAAAAGLLPVPPRQQLPRQAEGY